MTRYTKKAQQICETVCKVPAGKVCSYGKIADLAGLPGRARMVGSVMQYAPAEMKVPWYRILRSDGCIALGKGSDAARRQMELLRAEGVEVYNHRVDMKQYGWQPDLAELLSLEY